VRSAVHDCNIRCKPTGPAEFAVVPPGYSGQKASHQSPVLRHKQTKSNLNIRLLAGNTDLFLNSVDGTNGF
jgi:hypothetical protein